MIRATITALGSKSPMRSYRRRRMLIDQSHLNKCYDYWALLAHLANLRSRTMDVHIMQLANLTQNPTHMSNPSWIVLLCLWIANGLSVFTNGVCVHNATSQPYTKPYTTIDVKSVLVCAIMLIECL
jgi:hypothetical protein